MSAIPQPDAELIQQCLRGQRSAFQVLYRRYQGPVRSTLFQLCGAAELDDLVQEVFLRAWKGLPKFRQSAQFSTWLYRIAWNVASDRRHALGKARSHPLSPPLTLATGQADLTQLHYQDLVQRGLQALSLEHRAVIVLHDLEDLPQQEIASILNIPKGTVKSRLHHARSALRTFLQTEGVQL
ncbi:sigma-70 family RNA polymerase sigma factor [Leptolyngbya iicbica]|uniref:Sigma-70 family RNA polymerase sigma factor n=2 Tax=Cyanophyceae TaxID=3028117 RepID=A0A4V2E2C2_9CYAN|nr:sigma-70 family RNA polymerase sigma factor [Leptolyngbya sp. LK]RZM77846.1 sigma-70 family RNA polymerase sigma factor [Leptolyngbya sp. LK]